MRITRVLVGALLWALVVGAAEFPQEHAAFKSAVEAVQKRAHAHPEGSARYFAELLKGFRELQKAHPTEPEVYAELLFVADQTSGPESDAMIRDIAGEVRAPEAIRAKAKGIMAKRSALGREFGFAARDIHATEVRSESWRGKVVLLDFWATWCPPCREKLPEVKSLYSKHRSHGFEIVGISFDDDIDVLKRFISAEGVEWPQVADGKGWTEGPRSREFGLTRLPGMWLIDRQGRLRDIDARTDLTRKVEALLAEK